MERARFSFKIDLHPMPVNSLHRAGSHLRQSNSCFPDCVGLSANVVLEII